MTTLHQLVLLMCVAACSSFQRPAATFLRMPPILQHNMVRKDVTDDDVTSSSSSQQMMMSRRNILLELATSGIMASALLVGVPSASAAVPSTSDLKRLQVGHSRVRYLLENWDRLTESCNNKAMSKTESIQVVRTDGGGGGFCDKTPLVVQDYLGYKSTTDPLFKADALMLKAVPLVDDSVMDEADFVDLVEQYRDKSDQTSLLAYTSSWGEANPNGSKDTTDDYLLQTKKVVSETEVLLRKILVGLNLEILPPSEKTKA